MVAARGPGGPRARAAAPPFPLGPAGRGRCALPDVMEHLAVIGWRGAGHAGIHSPGSGGRGAGACSGCSVTSSGARAGADLEMVTRELTRVFSRGLSAELRHHLGPARALLLLCCAPLPIPIAVLSGSFLAPASGLPPAPPVCRGEPPHSCPGVPPPQLLRAL